MTDWSGVVAQPVRKPVKQPPQDHAACILAIVGSRDVEPKAARKLINEALDRHKPVMVISGGAKTNLTSRAKGLVSIDTEAVAVARAAGLVVNEILPTNFHWDGVGGFKERNQKIADACICLVRIASTTSTTYGSGWTADYAAGAGKNVERFTVDEKGEITNG